MVNEIIMPSIFDTSDYPNDQKNHHIHTSSKKKKSSNKSNNKSDNKLDNKLDKVSHDKDNSDDNTDNTDMESVDKLDNTDMVSSDTSDNGSNNNSDNTNYNSDDTSNNNSEDNSEVNSEDNSEDNSDDTDSIDELFDGKRTFKNDIPYYITRRKINEYIQKKENYKMHSNIIFILNKIFKTKFTSLSEMKKITFDKIPSPQKFSKIMRSYPNLDDEFNIRHTSKYNIIPTHKMINAILNKIKYSFVEIETDTEIYYTVKPYIRF